MIAIDIADQCRELGFANFLDCMSHIFNFTLF
jgi:hypothetical protein